VRSRPAWLHREQLSQKKKSDCLHLNIEDELSMDTRASKWLAQQVETLVTESHALGLIPGLTW
jgi:hypothetical protein